MPRSSWIFGLLFSLSLLACVRRFSGADAGIQAAVDWVGARPCGAMEAVCDVVSMTFVNQGSRPVRVVEYTLRWPGGREVVHPEGFELPQGVPVQRTASVPADSILPRRPPFPLPEPAASASVRVDVEAIVVEVR